MTSIQYRPIVYGPLSQYETIDILLQPHHKDQIIMIEW